MMLQHACACSFVCICGLLGVHSVDDCGAHAALRVGVEGMDVEQDAFMCVIACEWVMWVIVVLCDRVCVVWQTDGATPLYIASQEGHDEVVRALVGAGAALNQATVRGDLGRRWCSGARGWLLLGLQHARAASCACVCVCVCWVCMAIERCDGHAALRFAPRPLI